MSGAPVAFVGRGYERAVERDGEVLVVGAGAVHRLNPSAGLLWQLWRDPADPAAITADLVAATGADPETVGADVLEATAGLLQAGLLAPVDTGLDPDRMILEPVPACSGCGPGPDYECHVVVTVGAAALAIGADRELAEALASAFGDRTIDVRPPAGRASYGLVVPVPVAGPIQELARLHRGPDVLVRARDPFRVLQALVDQVGAHDAPPDVLHLDAVAVVAAAGAAVVPVPRDRARFDRSVRATGVRASDGAVVAVADTTTVPAVVIGAPWLGFDPAPVRPVLDVRRGRDESELAATAGRHPLVGFGVSAAPGLGRVIGELGPSAPVAGSDVAGRLGALVARVGVAVGTGPEILGSVPD